MRYLQTIVGIAALMVSGEYPAHAQTAAVPALPRSGSSASPLSEVYCQHLCDAAVLLPGEKAEHCYQRVHYALSAQERFFYESQKYRHGTAINACLRTHEDVMFAASQKIPAYDCQRLEYVKTLQVSKDIWNKECGETPSAWWCEIDLSRPYYAFVVPYYKGKGCPSLLPLRTAQ